MYQNQFLKNLIKRRMKISLALLISFFFLEKTGYSLTNESYLENSYEDNNNSLEKLENVGNGMTFNEALDEVFTNDGVIKGSASIDSPEFVELFTVGSGVELKNNIKSIENNGLINGNVKINNNLVKPYSNFGFPLHSENNGNGIENYNEANTTVASIENNGIIKGKINDLTNKAVDDGLRSAYLLTLSGNGISNSNSFYEKLISGNIDFVGDNAVIKNLINQGVISGNANSSIFNMQYALINSGNGINNSSFNKKSTIDNFFNNGVISGSGAINLKGELIQNHNFSIFNSGNGIYGGTYPGDFYDRGDSIIVSSENQGLIVGNIAMNKVGSVNGYTQIETSGNGMYSLNFENIFNKGTISGRMKIETFDGTLFSEYSGSGIVSTNFIKNLNNIGLIKGSESALSIGDIDNSISNNYGILAGKNIIVDNRGNEIASANHQNYGIEIKLKDGGNYSVELDGDGNPIVESISLSGSKEVLIESKDNDGNIIQLTKYIVNGSETGDITTSATDLVGNKDVYVNSSKLDKNSDLIINGSGINKGALVVDIETTLKDSIINGYETGLFIEGDNRFQGENVVINGGGLGKQNDNGTPADITDDYFIYENVIQGDSGNNIVELTGNSIVNGSVDLGAGDNRLSISNDTQLNGNVNGGIEDNDILNLGKETTTKTSSILNIFHEVSGFETVSTNGNVTLFETSKVVGAKEINLESGNLVLRVDPTVKVDGKITGHALYGNDGTLTSTGGNLVVGLNGLGEGATISMGGTTITPDTNDSWWKDTDHIKTNSLVLDGKLSEDGNDIYITVLEDLPTPPVSEDTLLYEKLNKVYQSIVSAGEIGSLANTTLLDDKTEEESLGGLLTILDQIYVNNPYAYTLKSSRDSLKLFEDNMSYLTIKPKKDEVIVQGKAIYTGVKNDSSASGKNHYGFDTGHRNYKTTINTVGGLATFEYGLSDKSSVGFVFGGNNQDVKFKGSSKIKGNSLYLGTFAKTDIKNFKFMSGVGYQYTSADADRKVSNRYDSFSTGDKYDINSLNAFVEVKYIYSVEQDWTVEPKVRLSYYYIDQDKVNEGYTPGQISMKTDKVNSNTADAEIGVDFVKSLYLNNGKLKNILSLGIINTIGDKSKELNGYILGKEKDGKRFDIQGVELPKTSGKVSYNVELEQTNGMIYTAGVSLEFAKDYNRNVNATIGIGYKF